MPTRIKPSNARTTCVYDAPGRQILVTTPNGQRHSFAYDAGSNRQAVLTATTDRVTYAHEPQAKSLCQCRAGAGARAIAWQRDPSGNQRLASVDGGRTTFLYDATNCRGTSRAAACRATFVCEIKGTEPIALVFRSASSDVQDAYRLFLEFIDATDPETVRSLLGAFVTGAALEHLLEKARFAILKDFANYGDLPAEFEQATILVVLTRLTTNRSAFRSTYRDEGPVRFGGWLTKVVLRDGKRAWKRFGPEWVERSMSRIDGDFHDVPAPPEPEDFRDELRDLIPQIPRPRTRLVIEDVLDYLKVRESAQKREISQSTVKRHRQLARAFLERLLKSDD